MGPLDKYILREDALKATDHGLELSFQSHWYRSLPLSCMDFKLKLSGNELSTDLYKIKINNKEFNYYELQDLDKEWLFILDKAVLNVPTEHPLLPGTMYDIEFKYDLYIPYILIGPQGSPLMASSVVRKKLICQ